ncbi:MAG: insulinase family protein [Deltaproteobacteria bacterium]|nr:insulinase family protein [Deltaproteobacteria bacterium]
MRSFTFGAALLAATASAAAPLSVPTTKFTLKNGMTVVLHEDHSVPRVHFGLRFGVGSSRESPGRTGFAHLFEHLMFEGSAHVPEGKFDQWLEAAGGENNAYTSEDVTFYYEEVPSNATDLPLFLDSDRMGFFADKLVPDLVEGQRDIVKNERRQSYENRPWGNAELLLPAALWPKGHPYSWPVIGSMEDLNKASIDDVRSFYTKWYAPENAVMVVVGDFDTSAMRKQIEHWYADVPGRGAVEKPKPAPHTLAAEKRMVVEDPQAPFGQLQIVWPTVETFHADDANLDMLADILGTGAGSRLTKRLVHELQLAQQVAVYQQSMERAGTFTIMVLANPGGDLNAIARVVDEELARLKKDGVSAAELERARVGAETAMANGLDSLSGKAQSLAQYTATWGQPDGFERDLKRYRDVTAQSVAEVARRRLGKGRVVLSALPPGQAQLAVVNPIGGGK